jgi:CBS domain-containing protein
MKAADIMTGRVISVTPDASILECARLMLQHRISGLPVIDAAGNLVGIVSEGDFLRRVEAGTERKRARWLEFITGPARLAGEYVHSHGRRVDEVMTREPLTIMEDTPVDDVVRLMEEHRVKRFPVTRGAKVVGIVSRANLLRALAGVAREAAPAAQDDQALRRSARRYWPNLPGSPGRRAISSTSRSATAWSNCGASSPPTTSATRRRSLPRTCPASRKSSITSPGSNRLPAS